MRIKRIEIDSYRSCKQVAFSLSENITSLIGVNGSGKSNVLNALLLLKKATSRAPRFQHRKKQALDQSEIRATLVQRNTEINLRAVIEFETDERNSDVVTGYKFTWNVPKITGTEWVGYPDFEFDTIAHRFRNSELHYMQHYGIRVKRQARKFAHSKLALKSPQTKKLFTLIAEAKEYLANITYYSATQFSDPSRCPISIELDEGQLRSSLENTWHEQFIYELYKAHKEKSKKFDLFVSVVSGAGLNLIDSVSFKEVPIPSNTIKVQSGGKVRSIPRRRVLVVPTFAIGNNKLSPYQLSEGTFKTLALVYYVLNDTSSLLLIEEPEACIHHGLLKALIVLLLNRSRTRPIIFSTHSEVVLDRLKPENVLLVRYSKNRGTTVNPLVTSFSRSGYKGLSQYLERIGSLGEYWRESGFAK